MNKSSFIRFVEKDRGSDEAMLDNAVRRGLRRAKNAGLDSRKFFALAAAALFTAAICFTVNLRPFVSAAESYNRNRIETMPGSGEVLESYIRNIAHNVRKYFGGV